MTNNQHNTLTHTDVIIIGAGPIGLSMCQALKDSGLKVHLIEKQTHAQIADPQPDGRETSVTHRTKKILTTLEQWQQTDPEHIHLLKRAEVYNGRSPFILRFDKPDLVKGKPIESLGFLISNYRLRHSAYNVLQRELDNPTFLTTMFDQRVESIATSQEYAQVTLATGETIQGKLVIGADSRISLTRKLLGISTDMHDFGRTVILFRCKHTQSNQFTAHEGFYYGKTLAVLPLGEYESSMVITIDNTKVQDIINLSHEQLAQEMTNWLNGSLGEMTVSTQLYQHPLLAVHADSFCTTRGALIGDAGVGMHPVTAHGYNLGMESVEMLSELICKAVAQGQDIGNPQLLARYNRKHNLKTRPLYHGTNHIVKLYTDERKPAKIVRHLGLRIGDKFSPIKKMITNQLTG